MVQDGRCLGLHKWAGVILRNIPKNAESLKIQNNLQQVQYPAEKAQCEENSAAEVNLHERKQSVRIICVAEKMEIKK